MKRENCWELMNCDRHSESKINFKTGVCPAAKNSEFDGINNGKFAGRVCWTIAGSFCLKNKLGTFSDKMMTCLYCEFFEKVREEEGENFISIPEFSEDKSK